MTEFGSDFHYIASCSTPGKSIRDIFPSANYYADGRQALIHLYRSEGWSRLWVPRYFCYEVLDSLIKAGVTIEFYDDIPGSEGEELALGLPFDDSDALLRVNYFGTRRFRLNAGISVPVIEDHTHDLIGDWASKSDADWCIASLRKTLPIPEGGILWSPVGLALPDAPVSLEENELIAEARWKAMKAKSQYLEGLDIEKNAFRSIFINTEGFFDSAPVCSLDRMSLDYLQSFDVPDWYDRKRKNWELIRNLDFECVEVLLPESDDCFPFSLVLLFDSQDRRDMVRHKLIEKQVFPAILWDIPDGIEGKSSEFSRRMLSIHCDGRYSPADILQMKSIIESVI